VNDTNLKEKKEGKLHTLAPITNHLTIPQRNSIGTNIFL
jgi:hypothetical protein